MIQYNTLLFYKCIFYYYYVTLVSELFNRKKEI